MHSTVAALFLIHLLALANGEEGNPTLDEISLESRQIVEKCVKSAKMDLQLIVDSSKSVGEESFHTMMKKIADDVIHQFNIGKDATRVALFKYSGHKVMVNEFGLGAYSTAASLEDAIKATDFAAGYTMTALAMQRALKFYTKESRNDKATAKVCIVFTDGEANDANKVPAATKAWEQHGAKVFAVGIGKDIDRKGLEDIAGSGDRVLQVKNFEAIGSMAKSLLVKICKEIPHPCDTKAKGGCQQYCFKEGKHAMCACKKGFKLAADKKTCVKLHVCDTEAKGGCSQICKKSGAAAICACQAGFKLGADKKSCIKIHACDTREKGGCRQICKKSGAAAVCACQAGFKLGADKKSCVKATCKWFCTVTQNRGVIAKTTNLRDAQNPLGQGNKNNRQAIIPMTNRNAGDPHTLPKGWGRGSMWWWDWWDINQMRDKCSKEQPVCGNSGQVKTDDCKWFCTVTQNRGVIAKTTNLREAQNPLGQGSKNNRQAIIPMTDRKAGDPHTLPKGWGRGSMWWWDWWDINQMRDKCSKEQPVCKGSKQVKPAGPLKWYCAVRINGGVRAKTTDLGAAQRALGQGNKNNRQAIIPMTDRSPGDPHTLSKGWGGGSMWWWGWDDIHAMQRTCGGSGLPG